MSRERARARERERARLLEKMRRCVPIVKRTKTKERKRILLV